ncbi:protocadherin-8 [Dromiciops gliroides]|uniref:protocadherin-8 n=1 Tax=Dromiciops gliroides TaxID=33562 RepID=UPI001CC45411|nr:protocadherin-8 [Dromiciops gliroides]
MTPVRQGGNPYLSPLQFFCLCLLFSVALSKTVRYSTFEEDVPGTVIGTLAEDMHMKASGEMSFRLMKQFNSSLIRVREADGQLTVGESGIDREQLCRQSPQCILPFDVVSFSQEQFRLVHVEVEVRDINDHSPRFPRSQIPVEVSESAAVGTRIPLEVAVDEDVGSNALQSLRLAEPHSPFRVELQTRADGAKCADLVLLQELDRESQATYSLELVAQDGGRPPRSATAALSVRVLDANDHSPAFPQGAVTEVELAEDAPVGSLLLDLDASDPDEGPNGDVVFSFGSRTPPEARRLFRLDPRSGRLTLAGPVDYERKETYELDVRAQDRGPGPRSATCKVIVRIRDVNDNAPDISITPLVVATAATHDPPGSHTAASFASPVSTSSAGPGGSESGVTSIIPEGATRESLVALVSTSDRDSGANGQVRCALYGHEHFRLQPAYAGSYLVVTAAPLDRERIAEYNLTLVAEDRGSPPLRTVKPYTVRVGDENDNAPLFARPIYEVSVRENNPPGAYLATVVARDPDLGRNGKVTYRLLEAEVGRGGEAVSTYVSVDPSTGAIYALRSFDYEALRQLDVRIQASDGGSPQLSSTTLVQVRVLDQNDHAPVLVHPTPANGSLELAVPGRTARDTAVVRVQARDADEGANGELTFSLLQQEPREAFSISRRSGEIVLTGDLSQDPPGRVFRGLLTVSDSGHPPLSTTATVSFVVTAGGVTGSSLPAAAGGPERSRPPGSRLSGTGSLQWDTPLIVIIVLAGSCTLLLAAIITIATTCNRRKKEVRKGGPRREERPGSASGGPSSPSSQEDRSLGPSSRANMFDVLAFPAGSSNGKAPFGGSTAESSQTVVAATEVPGTEGGGSARENACHYEGQKRLRGAHAEPFSSSPGYAKEPAPPVAIWKGHSFNTISGREAEKFSGKDSGKGDSDFNDSDSDISGDALKKDLINHMQSGLWACTAECKILGHSDRCWSPSCGRTNAHSSPHPSAQLSTFCKSTSLPRDPLRRDNYYQAQLPKTVGLQSVYEKVLHRDYDRTITLLSPPRPGRLPDLQEIGVPLYQPPPARYLPPQSGTNDNV